MRLVVKKITRHLQVPILVWSLLRLTDGFKNNSVVFYKAFFPNFSFLWLNRSQRFDSPLERRMVAQSSDFFFFGFLCMSAFRIFLFFFCCNNPDIQFFLQHFSFFNNVVVQVFDCLLTFSDNYALQIHRSPKVVQFAQYAGITTTQTGQDLVML